MAALKGKNQSASQAQDDLLWRIINALLKAEQGNSNEDTTQHGLMISVRAYLRAATDDQDPIRA